MQHLILRQDNLLAAVIRTELVRVLGVGVNKLPVRGPADIHLAGKQRVQCNRLPGAVPDDLRIGIAPYQQVAHERFPEDKARHLRIGGIMKQPIQRMIDGLFLAAIRCITV